MFIPAYLTLSTRTQFPVSLSLIERIKKNHFLEIRTGMAIDFYIYKDWSGRALGDTTNSFIPPKKFGIVLIPRIGVGYLYQPVTNGLFFNVLIQKLIGSDYEYWYRNLSVGIGYLF